MILAIIGGHPERFKPLIDLYRLAFERVGRPMQSVGVHSTGYIADTDAQAREELWEDYKPMRECIGAERGWPPFTRTNFDAEANRGSLYVGSAETVGRKIAATMKLLAVSRFDMKYSVGSMPHEKLLRSIELYGRKVIPIVRDVLC
jgi:alkanesulfonate monooxygenase SsuD/methylene tetrahydromethanopterin reductase-like flavin-dependent oxidoreductase (luciferase family)